MSDGFALPTASPRESWRFVRSALRGSGRRMALMTGVVLIGAVAGLLGPWLLGRIVDVIQHEAKGRISVLVALLFGVAGVQALATGASGVLITRLGGTVLAATRERAVATVVLLPVGEVEAAGSGDVVARVSGDVDIVSDAIGGVVAPVLGSLVTISTTIVGLAVLDWRFAAAGALAMPVQMHTLRWYLRESNPLYAKERVAVGVRSQAMLDTLGAIDTVRAYDLGPQRLAQVEQASAAALAVAVAGTRLRSRFFGRLNLAEVIGLGSILLVGFLLARDDLATVGACTAAALYFHRLFDPINTVLFSVDALQAANAGLARLVGLATSAPPVAVIRSPAPPPLALRARGLTHRYGERGFALEGVDLDLEGGRAVALVGASGAGKTTLAKLVAGQLAPTAGTLQVGATVAMVTQELHVFAGTLADDLRLASPAADDDQLRAALATVGAWPWVAALPDGLATIVGEGGHVLDGVQAQQLALARVLLVDPDLLVLDEATAEAGSAGAGALDDAARAVMAGRAVLIVAHRLSQARLADEILVLEDGRVVERGTHDELIAGGGRYGELWAAWRVHRS